MSAKEGLAIIIGKLKKKDEEKSKLSSLLSKPENDSDDTSNEDAQESAAEDMLAAIESKDAKALVAAMQDLMVLCQEDACEE